MNEEVKETVLKVAEYSNEEKKKETGKILLFFVFGIIALIINQAMSFMELEETFLVGFLEGTTGGIALGVMILGIFYVTGSFTKVCAAKKRLLGKE